MQRLILLSGIFLLSVHLCWNPCFAQKKVYATVLDEDSNPVARGFFKSAADSGIIILVENMEVFINSTEITTLKIEKNPSTAQFLKLGVAAGSEVTGYLINKPKQHKETENGVIKRDSTTYVRDTLERGGETAAALADLPDKAGFSMETKDVLFQNLQGLMQNLLIGTNDLATFSINQSSKKFVTKLRLLQQYSMDKEIVVWGKEGKDTKPKPASNVPLHNGFVIIGRPHVIIN